MVGTSNQLVPVAWPLKHGDFLKWGGTHFTRWMVKSHGREMGLPSGND